MQSTASNESSGQARLDSGAQPATEAQIEEYVRGFSAALNQLYQQRGVPAAVHARLQSSTSSDLNRPTPGQQSWSGQVISNSDCHRASTTIPLCVTRLESNFSDDQPLDEVQQQQPQQQSTNCRVNSTVDWCDAFSPVSSVTAAANVERQRPSAAATDGEDEKRVKNRLAAHRCRLKRLERQQAMRQQVQDVHVENDRLKVKIRRLRSRVEQLRSVLSEHRLGQCCILGSVQTTTVTASSSPCDTVTSSTTLDVE